MTVTLESLLNEPVVENMTIDFEEIALESVDIQMELSDIAAEINTIQLAGEIACEDADKSKNIFKTLLDKIIAGVKKIIKWFKKVGKELMRRLKGLFTGSMSHKLSDEEIEEFSQKYSKSILGDIEFVKRESGRLQEIKEYRSQLRVIFTKLREYTDEKINNNDADDLDEKIYKAFGDHFNINFDVVRKPLSPTKTFSYHKSDINIKSQPNLTKDDVQNIYNVVYDRSIMNGFISAYEEQEEFFHEYENKISLYEQRMFGENSPSVALEYKESAKILSGTYTELNEIFTNYRCAMVTVMKVHKDFDSIILKKT